MLHFALGPGGGRTVRQGPNPALDLRKVNRVACIPPSQQNVSSNQISCPPPQFGAVLLSLILGQHSSSALGLT